MAGCILFNQIVHHEHHLFSCCHSHECIISGAQLEGLAGPSAAVEVGAHECIVTDSLEFKGLMLSMKL